MHKAGPKQLAEWACGGRIAGQIAKSEKCPFSPVFWRGCRGLYGQKIARFRGPAGTSGAAPEPQGAGTLYGAGGVGENDPVNKGSREGETRQRHGRVLDGSILCVCQPSAPVHAHRGGRGTYAGSCNVVLTGEADWTRSWPCGRAMLLRSC